MEDISRIDMDRFKDVNVLVLSTDLLRREPDILKKFNANSFISNIAKNMGCSNYDKFN